MLVDDTDIPLWPNTDLSANIVFFHFFHLPIKEIFEYKMSLIALSNLPPLASKLFFLVSVSYCTAVSPSLSGFSRYLLQRVDEQ